jgi:hypothetical protein
MKVRGQKVTSLTNAKAVYLTLEQSHFVPALDRAHLHELVKACVFHRVREARQGIDELQISVTVASPMYDLQEDYSDICSLVDGAIVDAMDFLPEATTTDKDYQAIVEGAIAGIELTKREAIRKAEAEIRKIQAYIEDQEAELSQVNNAVVSHLYPAPNVNPVLGSG